MSQCSHEGCPNQSEDGKDECFRHRVLGVGISFRGGAVLGRRGWHTTQREWLKENLGAETGKELAKRQDIEKV